MLWYIRPKFGPVILTTSGALAFANSLKFNLQDKKQELNSAIYKLERIRKNIEYVISCNGDFSEKESGKLSRIVKISNF